MGQKCSAGMPDNVVNKDPILAEVSRTIHSEVPGLLQFQATGAKKDFGALESFCKDMNTRFVFHDGRVANAMQVRESAGPSAYSEVLLKSLDNVSLFCDKNACVATITVECFYSMKPGQYSISENTIAMAKPSVTSETREKLDKGAKVTVDKVVRVGERLRGQLRGGTWITLEKKGSDVQFVSLLHADPKCVGEFYIYSLTLERCETQEDQFDWKLIHVTMQPRD